MTGAEYEKLPNGPAPRRLLPVRRRLEAEAEGVVEVEQVIDRFGYRQDRLCPLLTSPPQLLDAAEHETIDGVPDQLADSVRRRFEELIEEFGDRISDRATS